jgi:glutathione peroxidase-family protein
LFSVGLTVEYTTFYALFPIQFGAQEPGTEEEILEFVKKYDEKMADKLVFFEKGPVNGADTREVFAFLKEQLPDDDGSIAIRWNFSESDGRNACVNQQWDIFEIDTNTKFVFSL